MAFLARFLTQSRLAVSNRHSDLKILLPLVIKQHHHQIDASLKSTVVSDRQSDRKEASSSYDEIKTRFEHLMVNTPDWFIQTEFHSLIKESRSDSQVDYLLEIFRKFNQDSTSFVMIKKFSVLTKNLLTEKKFDKLCEIVNDQSLHIFVFKRLRKTELIMKSCYRNQRYEDVLRLVEKQIEFKERNARLVYIKRDQMIWIGKSLLHLKDRIFYEKFKTILAKCPLTYQELTQSSLARLTYLAITHNDTEFANQLLEKITDQVLLFNLQEMAKSRTLDGSFESIVDQLERRELKSINVQPEEETNKPREEVRRELKSINVQPEEETNKPREEVRRESSSIPYVKQQQSYNTLRGVDDKSATALDAEIQEFMKLSRMKESVHGLSKEQKLVNLREVLTRMLLNRNKTGLVINNIQDMILLGETNEDFQLSMNTISLIKDESIVRTFISNLVKRLYQTSRFESAQELFAHKKWTKYLNSTSTLLLMHLFLEQKSYSQVVRVFQSYVGPNKGTITSAHVYPISFSLLRQNYQISNQISFELSKQFVLSLKSQNINADARRFASVCFMYLAILQNKPKYCLDHLYLNKFKESNPDIFHNFKIIGYARLHKLNDVLEELETAMNSEKVYLFRYTIDTIQESLNNEQLSDRLRDNLSKLNKISSPSLYDYGTMESQIDSQILSKLRLKFS